MEIVEEEYASSRRAKSFHRLRCNVNTVFDTSMCIACNGCVDVCPENLIRLVGLSSSSTTAVRGDSGGALGATREQVCNGSLALARWAGDEGQTTCIRCAMCASRCPTHAITMRHFDFYRECVSVPVQNSKILYSRESR